jgi:hypothetical protein
VLVLSHPPTLSSLLLRAYAGGRMRPVPHKLVVDVREFMSGLPAVLHSQGFKLTPITLEVRKATVFLLWCGM